MLAKSKLEETFMLQIKASDLPLPSREYKFFPQRRWRADFAWPLLKIIVEIEGGIYTNGRHVRPLGFKNDCVKYNIAALEGWIVLRITSEHVDSLEGLTWLKRAIKIRKKDFQMYYS